MGIPPPLISSTSAASASRSLCVTTSRPITSTAPKQGLAHSLSLTHLLVHSSHTDVRGVATASTAPAAPASAPRNSDGPTPPPPGECADIPAGKADAGPALELGRVNVPSAAGKACSRSAAASATLGRGRVGVGGRGTGVFERACEVVATAVAVARTGVMGRPCAAVEV